MLWWLPRQHEQTFLARSAVSAIRKRQQTAASCLPVAKLALKLHAIGALIYTDTVVLAAGKLPLILGGVWGLLV